MNSLESRRFLGYVATAIVTAISVAVFMFTIGDRFYASKEEMSKVRTEVEAMRVLNNELVKQNTLVLDKQNQILSNQTRIITDLELVGRKLKTEE